MMQLGRRTSLLVAFYLLTSTATAYAECAWEEYPERTAGDVIDPARRWLAVGGYATRRDCDEAVKFVYRQAAKEGSKLAGRPTCFPDTVDPRGPKGK